MPPPTRQVFPGMGVGGGWLCWPLIYKDVHISSRFKADRGLPLARPVSGLRTLSRTLGLIQNPFFERDPTTTTTMRPFALLSPYNSRPEKGGGAVFLKAGHYGLLDFRAALIAVLFVIKIIQISPGPLD